MSEWFQMTVDKDPLPPRSFVLFLDRIMDKIKNRENSGVIVHGNRVNNLRFADDIDIIEHSNEKLQDTVDKLHTESVSRLPLDAMRGSLFDLTTGRISHYIL